jgi:PAS domain S-box-containing protein
MEALNLIIIGFGILEILAIIIFIIVLLFQANSKSMLNNSDDIIYLYKIYPKKKLKYIIGSTEEFCGYSKKEFYNDPELFTKIIHHEDYPLLEYMELNTSNKNIPIVMRWVKKDGSIIWVEQKSTHILNKKGKAYAVSGIVRNISHQKEEELYLREDYKVYREIFQKANDYILLFEIAEDIYMSKLIKMNNLTVHLIEYKPEEIYTLKLKDIFDIETMYNIKKIIANSSKQRKSTFDSYLTTKSGIKINI